MAERVDLKKRAIERLSIAFSAEMDDSRLTSLRRISPADLDGDSFFSVIYRRSRTQHRGWAWVKPHDATTGSVEVNINYDLRAARPVADSAALSDFFRLTEEWHIPVHLKARVDFSLSLDSFKPFLALPLRICEGQDTAFDTVEGIHVSKHSGDISLYDVLIEYVANREVFAVVSFKNESTLCSELVTEVVNRALEIRGLFIARDPEEKDGE